MRSDSSDNNSIRQDSALSAFTVDVEDGVSIAMRDAFGIDTKQTNRVVINTMQIMELLSEFEVKGTFFILGKVAEDFPELVKEIANEGHEIGVHGYNHYVFSKMTRKLAHEELSSAKKILEDISGKQILGHRAPAFSIHPKTAWGLEVIAACGFTYDSSILPADIGPFVWSKFPKNIVQIEMTDASQLLEVPISTARLLGKSLPYCGGSYLRLLPYWVTDKLFSNETVGANILYIHPYELDTEKYPDYYFKALRNAPLTKNLKMRLYWINRSKTYLKLERLLKNYAFTTVTNLIKNTSADPVKLRVNTKKGTFSR